MNQQPRVSYISQFFILIGLIVGGFIIGSLAAFVAWMALEGGPLATMEKDMLNPANATSLKIVQLFASGVMFLVPALLFAVIVNRKPLRHLGFKTRFTLPQLGMVAVIMLAALFLSGALGQVMEWIPLGDKAEKWFRSLEKSYNDQVMVMAQMKSFGDYLFTLLVIAIAPAFFEELLFRGAMQQLMVKWTDKAWLGILITSIVFSAIHFSYYGFLSRMALGIVLGYLFYYSKSIWLPVFGHFLNNGFAVTMMFVLQRQGKLTQEAMNDRYPAWWALVTIAVLVVLFYLFRKESQEKGSYAVDNTHEDNNNPFEHYRL